MALTLILSSFTLLILCAVFVIYRLPELRTAFGIWLFTLLFLCSLALIFHTATLHSSRSANRVLYMATTGLLLATVAIAGMKPVKADHHSIPLCGAVVFFCTFLVADMLLHQINALLSLWLVPSGALSVAITAFACERKITALNFSIDCPPPLVCPSTAMERTHTISGDSTSDLLSDREREVAELLAQGKTYREIGESLFIAPSTVKSHALRIYEKLSVDNKVALANALRAESSLRT